MGGYDGDSISEAEWDGAERQYVEEGEDDVDCCEGPSDMFDDD